MAGQTCPRHSVEWLGGVRARWVVQPAGIARSALCRGRAGNEERGPACQPAGRSVLGAQPGRRCGLPGDPAEALACSALCHPAWSVTGARGGVVQPVLGTRRPAWLEVGTGGSSGRPGCMLGTLSAAWAVLGPGRSTSQHVRVLGAQHGRLRAQAGGQPPQLALGTPSEQPGWWQDRAGHPAGQTFMLGTLTPSLSGDMARRFRQVRWTPCARCSATHGLGDGGAQRVVQLAGLARSTLCHPAWAVKGHSGLSRQPDLHARHSATCFGRSSGASGFHPACQTCTLGTLSSGLGSGRARRVVQPARLTGSVLAQVLAGRAGHLFGRTCTLDTLSRGLGCDRPAGRPATDLHARHSVGGLAMAVPGK